MDYEIYTFFVSPGAASERIHLYFAEVFSRDKKGNGGGLVSEGEDIRLLKVTMPNLLDLLQRGEIMDAKSIIGIQWLIDHRKERGIL